jgi:16S rRNA (cytosine967-C5)-methyltransferase
MGRTTGSGPRRAALRILEQVRGGKPFEVALDHELGDLPELDRRLAHELAAGVLRSRSSLDTRLAPLVTRRWNQVTPELQDILRLGAYQLTELERVPVHAAVDTSVSLARSAGGTKAAGFVNAVLRRLTRSRPPEIPSLMSGPEQLAREYSHPVWLVRRWNQQFGPEGTETLLRWNNTRPRLTIQPARAEIADLSRRWEQIGIESEPAPCGAGLVVEVSRPSELEGYEEGAFVVQNPAQALLVRYVDLAPGATVYDACAAPGGKTVALGRHAGTVVAGEVSPQRARRLQTNVARAGSGREHVVVADGRYPPLCRADVVLLDAPCLGTGTFARHPDARWRVTERALASLTRLQAELLHSTAEVVRPGGLLVYATCSLEPEENVRQVDRFLERHPSFSREAPGEFPASLLSPEGDLMILPHQHGMDGAYAARLRHRP